MAKTSKKDFAIDDFASILANSLNDKLGTKDEKSVYTLNDPNNPTIITDYISTGSDIIDLAISNRPNGGLPLGKIVEVSGLEQTGKTVFCASIIAQTQKKGGIGMYIDTERAVNPMFFEMLGVDITKNFVYSSLNKIEDVLYAVEQTALKKLESGNKQLLTICVDSVAGATTKASVENDYELAGYATQKARIISEGLPKLTQIIARANVLVVFTNQLRQKLNAMVGQDPYDTPGGRALPFFATVRLRLQNVGKVTDSKTKQVLGQHVKVKVVKNRIGPPNTVAEYDFLYESGIDNYISWFNVLKKHNLIKSAGAWYTYINETTGEEIKFQSKDFYKLLEDEDLKNQIYKKICDKLILVYRKPGGIQIEDLELTYDEDDNTDETIENMKIIETEPIKNVKKELLLETNVLAVEPVEYIEVADNNNDISTTENVSVNWEDDYVELDDYIKND